MERLGGMPGRGLASAEALIAAAASADAHHRGGETVAGRALTAALTLPLRRRRHRGAIRYDDVVRPDLRTGDGEILTAKVYRPGR